MPPAFSVSPTWVNLRGKAIPGAEDRQRKIPGFDQQVYSISRLCFVGAGGIASPIALSVVRKGIGAVTLMDDDVVESSNLNRQRFYEKDLGKNKAGALAENLVGECIAATDIRSIPLRLGEAIASRVDLAFDVAICGVDNNPGRVEASRYFRSSRTPVVFAAVSREGDHGYVFVQDKYGPCAGCLFPDMADDDRYPCPGTPAIADILLAVGALAVYAIDSLLMNRPRAWNYRRVSLSDGILDGCALIPERPSCSLCSPFGAA